MKLIHKQQKEELKKRLSEAICCVNFEPELCCFCEQVGKFVDKLAETKHNPKVCQDES